MCLTKEKARASQFLYQDSVDKLLQVLLYIFYILLLLHGVGVGSVITSLANIALSGLSESLAGSASGVYNTFQQVAAIVGIVAVGSIYYYFLGGKSLQEHYQYAFSIAVLINILCLFFVMLAVFKVPEYVLPKRIRP